MDVITANRSHIGEIFMSSALRVPVIVLLGIQLDQIALYELLMFVVVQFHHADISVTERWDRVSEKFQIKKKYTIAIARALLPILINCSQTDKATAYGATESQQEIDQSHSAFTSILRRHMKNEKVDYAGLKSNPGEFTAYLDTSLPATRSDGSCTTGSCGGPGNLLLGGMIAFHLISTSVSWNSS